MDHTKYEQLDSFLARESRLVGVLNQRAEDLEFAKRAEHEARSAWRQAHDNVEKEMRILRKGGN